eukprot:10330516-Prorocentrum_lima.AAC.1
MTSSLVGSEMCIRDSSNSVTYHNLRAMASVEHRSDAWVHNQVEKTQWTVSYTHLTLPTICSV